MYEYVIASVGTLLIGVVGIMGVKRTLGISVLFAYIAIYGIWDNLHASTITTTYDPDEFEIVRKSKGIQFMPNNPMRFISYSTQTRIRPYVLDHNTPLTWSNPCRTE